MKRTEPISIGDVLRQTIHECNMEARLAEVRAIELWRPIVGEHLAKLCGRPTVSNGVMRISVPGASLRHELTMSRSSIIKLMNSRLGKSVIKEIKFTS
ncbi:MAG: DUF721 domain-containing protein [Muribaculaceae bacterium]|nr:DUF721 domain-containing protein [Muribaculaceae bacterium]